MENTLIKGFNSKYIPFDKITNDDYEPAIKHAIELHGKEVAQIANNPEKPTFENTILALERSGEMLSRVLGIFYPMLSACLDDELMTISNKMAPLLSEHANNVTLNERLWSRIKTVKENFNAEQYDSEDQMLLQVTFDSFVRSGASLQGPKREEYRSLTLHLTESTLKFEQNLLKETNAYKLWLTNDDIDGLPESALEAAKLAAKENGNTSEYLITLHAPSYMPFMKFSKREDLREKLYMAYNSRCTKGEFSNMDLIRDIANTRLRIVKLLGYENFAQYRLIKSMAQSPDNVLNLLDTLYEAYRPAQNSEMKKLQEFATRYEGHAIKIKPWNYAYYSNLEREEKFNFKDEILRPYFDLNHVIEGVFGLATRLYGLQFNENRDAPVFHKDVKVFDVIDEDGKEIGTLYTDFFPRSTKQGGAWMTNFVVQRHDYTGRDIRPVVSLTMNFTKPTATKPSLLTYREVNTFLHEFGHGLHSLLSKCKYESLSGTNVFRDFVEMPSQFNENFLTEREFLDSFAYHYQTSEPIPEDIITKVINSQQYGAGYSCLRQLSFGYLDMAWHMITEEMDGDVIEFENKSQEKSRIFESVPGCLLSPQFSHIFAGGYASGYYGYKWAEVLDADAFGKFKEDGIFNKETAKSLVSNILSQGGKEHPMSLYKRFRGREPKIDALLARDGIKSKDN